VTARQRKYDIGPTGRTVSANVIRLRAVQDLTSKELAYRTPADHQLDRSIVLKIERGERRVDVDDLIALSIAFDVSPLALLLPSPRTPGEVVHVTGASATAAKFWGWALAQTPLTNRDRRAYLAQSIPFWVSVRAAIRARS
jgi:hypothetical protein